MTKSEALAYFDGNVSALARALDMDQSSFYSWKETPPGGRQLQLERITGGKLKADPGCMQRPRQSRVTQQQQPQPKPEDDDTPLDWSCKG